MQVKETATVLLYYVQHPSSTMGKNDLLSRIEICRAFQFHVILLEFFISLEDLKFLRILL